MEIPARLASKVLKFVHRRPVWPTVGVLILLYSILRPVLPIGVGDSKPYYFLRRLVTSPHLPLHLRDDVQTRDASATVHLLIPPPLPPDSGDIVAALRPHIQSGNFPVVRSTQIPLDPPTSAEQAALWSNNYWPCIFNPASQTIQKAPPLHVLRTVQAELHKPAHLETCFRLASLAAAECVAQALGREVAAAVVDPMTGKVIAVAGDARWFGQSSDLMTEEDHCVGLPDGRPEYHALMRAIAMVAEKEERRRSGTKSSSSKGAEGDRTHLGGRTTTPIEKFYAAVGVEKRAGAKEFPALPKPQSAERPDAYLCHGLDVYMTHEPCIACSMAMVHSRFRACVFSKRMPRTGGLCAEKDNGGLGYGLFWRKELNWRVLAFNYIPSPEGPVADSEGGGRQAEEHGGEIFHA